MQESSSLLGLPLTFKTTSLVVFANSSAAITNYISEEDTERMKESESESEEESPIYGHRRVQEGSL